MKNKFAILFRLAYLPDENDFMLNLIEFAMLLHNENF